MNPLYKSYKGELLKDWGEYLVIFLFMFSLVAICSGFLVADNSVTKVYQESFERYNVEDGHFELIGPIDINTEEKLNEDNEIVITEDFFKNLETENNQTIRVYTEREIINQIDLLEGRLPASEYEIAIDRLFAETNGYPIGSTINTSTDTFKVVGLIALSDYSSLFESNSDMMFDATQFGVGTITSETFEHINETPHYNYAWTYKNKTEDEILLKNRAEGIIENLDKTMVVNFLPAYSNKAITFTGEDFGSDKVGMIILCYILIVVISFVFYVTISHKIKRDSKIIGTLRAMGYTKSEIIIHYMALPILVCLVASILGNIIGYTYGVSLFRIVYDNNYSLTHFELSADLEAFLLTTVIPLLILIGILYFSLSRKLKFSPYQFLTENISSRHFGIRMNLPKRLKFMNKFKTRIFLSNMGTFFVLFVGLFFASILILFGFLLNPLLTKYEEEITNNIVAENQIILSAPYETNTDGAEKFSIETLETLPNLFMTEDILIYGIGEDSHYFNTINNEINNLKENQVIVSENILKKYHLSEGDILRLKESYGNEEYEFEIVSSFYFPSTLAVFMNQDQFNEVFDKEDGFFNGYLSDNKITDIPEQIILTRITSEDLVKVSRQLKTSFGAMMDLLKIVGLVISFFLIYLLTKVIIEKNEKTISLIKILGFSKMEIFSLYLIPVIIAILLSIVIALPLANNVLKYAMEDYIYTEMTGFLPYYIPENTFLLAAGIILLALIIALIIEFIRLEKIPKDLILKTTE